jgi:hypothetical protein
MSARISSSNRSRTRRGSRTAARPEVSVSSITAVAQRFGGPPAGVDVVDTEGLEGATSSPSARGGELVTKPDATADPAKPGSFHTSRASLSIGAHTRGHGIPAARLVSARIVGNHGPMQGFRFPDAFNRSLRPNGTRPVPLRARDVFGLASRSSRRRFSSKATRTRSTAPSR